MSDPDPAGHGAGGGSVRRIVVIAWLGSAVLAIAMVAEMGRWMIG